MVMFSSEGRKDSITFIEETKEFVCKSGDLGPARADEHDVGNVGAAPTK